MGLPNLLLAGAPKCGTTSVYDWLVQHPDVAGGIKKELFYLMDSSSWMYKKNCSYHEYGIEGYSQQFPEKKPIIVDGTTLTIYQDIALEYASANPLKVIIFVRNPISRIFSNFSYYQSSRTIIPIGYSFGEYVSDIVAGKTVVVGNEQINDAIEHSYYSKYISKWIDLLGEGNVKVYDMAEMKIDSRNMMKEIATWLDVDAEFYSDYTFESSNKTIKIKSARLNLIKEKFSNLLQDGVIKSKLKSWYYLLNGTVMEDSLENYPNEIALLEEVFSQEIENMKKYGIYF